MKLTLYILAFFFFTLQGVAESTKPKVLKGDEAKRFQEQMATGMNIQNKVKEEDQYTKKIEEKAELESQIRDLEEQIEATKPLTPRKAKDLEKKRSSLKEQVAIVGKELEQHKKNRERMDSPKK